MLETKISAANLIRIQLGRARDGGSGETTEEQARA
jgi:hypothetical protein